MLSTSVVSDDNSLSNNPGFCGKKTKCLQISLNNLGLKRLLGLNFKIVMTRYALAITIFSAKVRLYNKSV